jgi:hypothetical protein
MSKSTQFAGLTAILLGAAAVVSTAFGLADDFLLSILPPTENAVQTAKIVFFIMICLFLFLSVFIRKNLRVTTQKKLAVLALLLTFSALANFLFYQSHLNTYQFEFNDARQIRGRFHTDGIKRLSIGACADDASKNGTTSNACQQRTLEDFLDGWPNIELVRKKEVLWTVESEKEVAQELQIFYISVVMLFSSALFILGLISWRATKQKASD